MTENPELTAGPLTGWEVTAPQTDTVLRQFLLAQAAFQRLAGRCHDATVLETDCYIAVDTGRPATMMNFVLLKQPLLGPEFEETMQEIETIFGMPGKRGFAALYSPLPTPDLAPWGWTLAGHPPLQLRSPYTPPRDTSAVRIDRVETAEQMATFEQIIIEGFEMGEMQGSDPGALLPATLLENPGFRAYLGFIDGTAVSAAASVIEAGINLIPIVATLPAGRRKGTATAVTQAATQPELALPTVLFSSDEGRPVYERLGFVPILRGSFWYRNR